MAVARQPQTSIYESQIEDAELEAALEQREIAKASANSARKTFSEADEAAKTRIRELELGDAPVRVGRFLLSERGVAGRSVAFETQPRTRIWISILEDEDA